MADRPNAVASDFTPLPGDYVKIVGKHPWEGEMAVVIKERPPTTANDLRPRFNAYVLALVRPDAMNGHEFVADAANMERRDA